jgi:hypothetical protein
LGSYNFIKKDPVPFLNGGDTMPTSVEKIYEEAMSLPNESKAILVERIVEFLETHVNPDLERIHLDTVKRRRGEMRKGQVEPIDGQDASVMARRIINK